MNRIRPIARLLAVLALSLGCSREGFEESLSRNQGTSSSQQESSSKPPAVGAVYELDRLTAEGIEGEYLVPVTDSEDQEKAVKRISRAIRTMMKLLPQSMEKDGTTPALTLESEVTQNDGSYFSASFLLVAKTGEQEERYGWGMTFDAATGSPAGLDRFIEPEALAVLLLDGPSADLMEDDKEVAEKQRAYLTEQGSDALCERLLRSDQGELETLLDASYYLDGSKVVAVFSAPQEVGGVVRAAIKI